MLSRQGRSYSRLLQLLWETTITSDLHFTITKSWAWRILGHPKQRWFRLYIFWLGRKGINHLLALKCLWLGKIRSGDSQAANCPNCLAVFNFFFFLSPFPYFTCPGIFLASFSPTTVSVLYSREPAISPNNLRMLASPCWTPSPESWQQRIFAVWCEQSGI